MEPEINRSWNPTNQLIVNRLNGLAYRMVPAAQVTSTPEQLENLASICNQRSIYNSLFKERLNGRPYGMDDGRSFLDWAVQGWRAQTHFVFLIVTSTGLIAGALNIKLGDRNTAEVGYWCSELHRGLMSEAVAVLKSMASEASFSTLFARVRKDNLPSVGVLERNGFISLGDWPGDSTRLRYEATLGSS
jgi:RimJ/RimL family protein N-acetyltransferase